MKIINQFYSLLSNSNKTPIPPTAAALNQDEFTMSLILFIFSFLLFVYINIL